MDLGFYKSEKSKKNIELKEGKDDNGLYYYIDIGKCDDESDQENVC